MKKEKIESFFSRINNLTPDQKALFGQMNVNQMICHCADFFRIAFGEKRAEEYGKINPVEIIALARSGKTALAPKGFDQVKGEGTKPIDFEEDRVTLKMYIALFAELPADFNFAEHPYFRIMNKERWEKLMDYHLIHHLEQFGV